MPLTDYDAQIKDEFEAFKKQQNSQSEMDAEVARVFADRIKPEGRSVGRAIGDVGLSVVQGLVGTAESAVGLGDLVTGGRVGKAVQDSGLDFNQAKEAYQSLKSPQQQEAERKVAEANGFWNTLGTAVQNPSSIVSSVAESAPMLAGIGGYGRVAGKMLTPFIKSAATRGVAAGAFGEGILQAGSAAEQTRQQNETGLLTGKQALLSAASGAGTGVIGYFSGRLANKLGIADVDIAAAGGNVIEAAGKKGIARSVAEGMFTEGILEELPQSVQEQVLGNLAADKDPWDGVDQAAAMGMLAGSAMGGTFAGVFSGATPKQKEDIYNSLALENKINNLEKIKNASPEAKKNLEAYRKQVAEIDSALGEIIPEGKPVDVFAATDRQPGQYGDVIPQQRNIDAIDVNQESVEMLEINRRIGNLEKLSAVQRKDKVVKNNLERLKAQKEKIVSDHAAKVQDMADKIVSGKTDWTPQELQFQQNNPQEIEAELQARQSAAVKDSLTTQPDVPTEVMPQAMADRLQTQPKEVLNAKLAEEKNNAEGGRGGLPAMGAGRRISEIGVGETSQAAGDKEALAQGVGEAPQLTPDQQNFIQTKVNELGSVEAVNQAYGNNSAVDNYARRYAEEVLNGNNLYRRTDSQAVGKISQDPGRETTGHAAIDETANRPRNMVDGLRPGQQTEAEARNATPAQEDAQAAPGVEEKQPWEMTREEFVNSVISKEGRMKEVSTVVDWGSQKRQGKRSSGTVVGAMGNAPQGEKEYRGFIPDYVEYERNDDGIKDRRVDPGLYSSAREYGMSNKDAGIFALSQTTSHKRFVEDAISNGLSVPEKVLSEYPDLAASGKQPSNKQPVANQQVTQNQPTEERSRLIKENQPVAQNATAQGGQDGQAQGLQREVAFDLPGVGTGTKPSEMAASAQSVKVAELTSQRRKAQAITVTDPTVKMDGYVFVNGGRKTDKWQIVSQDGTVKQASGNIAARIPRLIKTGKTAEYTPNISQSAAKNSNNESIESFIRAADNGKLHKATGTILPGESDAINPIEMGRINGYSEDDIKHFYASRRGAYNESMQLKREKSYHIAYKEYLSDLEEIARNRRFKDLFPEQKQENAGQVKNKATQAEKMGHFVLKVAGEKVIKKRGQIEVDLGMYGKRKESADIYQDLGIAVYKQQGKANRKAYPVVDLKTGKAMFKAGSAVDATTFVKAFKSRNLSVPDFTTENPTDEEHKSRVAFAREVTDIATFVNSKNVPDSWGEPDVPMEPSVLPVKKGGQAARKGEGVNRRKPIDLLTPIPGLEEDRSSFPGNYTTHGVRHNRQVKGRRFEINTGTYSVYGENEPRTTHNVLQIVKGGYSPNTPTPILPHPVGFDDISKAKDWIENQKSIDKGLDVGSIYLKQNKEGAEQGDKPAEKDKASTVSLNEKNKPKAENEQAKIEDFGEKIGGARKDVYSSYQQKMKDAEDVDIASVPLSKAWPEPDYQALIDSGADPFVVGFVRAARDEVPTKPRRYVGGWVEKVKAIRGMALDIVDGTIKKERFLAQLDKTPVLAPVVGRAELYQEFGHGKSLKGISIQKHHYALYQGEKNVDIWAVEQRQKTTMWSNMPRELATGNTKEEALGNFRKVYDSVGSEANKRTTKFEIYAYRKDPNSWWIGKKVGSNYIDLKKFDSVKEAKAYQDNNRKELEALLEKAKGIPNERRETNRERVGVDRRNGKDVDGKTFMEAFGFRGVEFGNWVNNKERQDNLNQTYDAMLDLADIIGVPPKAMSLNGTLGIGFGSRGTGGIRPAKAHYEPDKIVINLTRKNGPGSLAHEWLHALDNYFSRSRGKKDGFITQRPYRLGPTDQVRSEVVDAFKNVMASIKATGMKERSARLDTRRSKDYWSTDLEMAARAFESYIIEKVAEEGGQNDYLANIVSADEYAKDMLDNLLGNENATAQDFYPYLLSSEIPQVRDAFDHLFNTLETRETESGVALFSKTENLPGLKAEDIEDKVKSITRTWKNVPRIVVVDDESGFPKKIRADISGANASGQIAGAYDKSTNTVYIVGKKMATFKDVEEVVFHELGHYWFNTYLGDDYFSATRDLYKALGGEEKILSMAEKYGIDISSYAENGRHLSQGNFEWMLVNELAAHLSQHQIEPTLMQKVVAAIRNALRKMGLAELANYNAADMLRVVSKAKQAVITGKNGTIAIGRKSETEKMQTRIPAHVMAALMGDRSGMTKGEPTAMFMRRPNGGVGLPPSKLEKLPSELKDKMDYLRLKWQDKFISLLRAQQDLVNLGWKKTEVNDAYLAEELYHDKAETRLNKFQDEHQSPLLKEMRDIGVSIKELEDYRYAKFAEERNAYIKKVNPNMPYAGSGMFATTQEKNEALKAGFKNLSGLRVADDVLAELSGKAQQLEKLSKRVDAITKLQRDIIRDEGLEGEEIVDAWEMGSKNYMPLKGGKDEEHVSVGQGFGVKGSGTKRAMGRSTEAENLLAHLFGQVGETIVRAEKVKVSRAFLKMVEENPSDVWTIHETIPTKRSVVNGKVQETTDFNFTSKENVVPVTREDGSVVYVEINPKAKFGGTNGKDLGRVMKNMTTGQHGKVIQTLGAFTRVLSSVNTMFNPEFVVTNFERDFQTAMIHLSGEQSGKMAKQVAKSVPSAMKGIQNALRGDKTHEYAKWYKRFREAGGGVSFMDLRGVEHIQKDIEKAVSGNTNKAREAANKVLKLVEDYNTVVENAVRLSAFKTAVDGGMSDARAASLAKNLTVNFNRKGELGPAMNALYMFFNAGAQGSARVVSSLLNSSRTRKIAGAIVLTSMGLAELNRLSAGDDDDDVNRWDKVNPYIKSTNLVFMRGDGSPVKVRVPYGYNFFVALGYAFSDTLHWAANDGGKDPAETAKNLYITAMNAFNPLGGDSSLLSMASPTVLDPFVEIATNENFMGSKIFPEQPPWGPKKPQSELYFRSVSQPSKYVAQALNSLTGGDKWTEGAISVSPEIIDHFTSYLTGGAGRTTRDFIFLPAELAKEKTEVRRIPFVRQVFQGTSDRYDIDQFYKNVEQVETAKNAVKEIPSSERKAYIESHPEFKLNALANNFRNNISRLRKMKYAAEDRGDEKAALRFEEQMRDVAMKFNKRFNQLQ